jgi:hypothetical protein
MNETRTVSQWCRSAPQQEIRRLGGTPCTPQNDPRRTCGYRYKGKIGQHCWLTLHISTLLCARYVELCIAVRSAIHERPRTIRRPLERSLLDDDNGFGRCGYPTVVVSISRWIGKRYSVHHGKHPPTAWRSVPWLRHQQEDAGDGEGAASVPSLLLTIC